MINLLELIEACFTAQDIVGLVNIVYALEKSIWSAVLRGDVL